MYTLPIEIPIEDKVLHIRERGDYRVILDCFSALQDIELDKQYRILTALFIFYDDFEDVDDLYDFPYVEEAAKEMFNFFNCGEPVYKPERDYRLIDWELDSQLIASAVNKVANTEIRSTPYIHWWTFMGYYNAIGECVLSSIISIRKKIVDGEKLEKSEKKFKRDNPQYFNRDFSGQEESNELLKDLWNN